MFKKRWQKLFIGVVILLTAVLLIGAMPACAPEPAPPTPPTPPPTPPPAPPPAPPPEKPIELLFASWGPPLEPHTPGFEAWKKELEERSEGRVKVEISYGGAFGPPPEHYDLAVTGVADVSQMPVTYNPGRFPISEAFTLPIIFPSAEIASKAYWELYKRGYLDKEYADAEVMYLFTTSSYSFIWAEKPAPTLADFKGRKVRVTGALHTELATLLGLVPVPKPAPESYLILQTGVVDGSWLPWSMLKTFNLHEVTKYFTEVSPEGRIAAVSWPVVMNKETWAKLPKDIQDIIIDMRDSERYTVMTGKGHDEWDADAIKMFTGAGGRIDTLSPAETTEMLEIFAPVWSSYVADAEAKGWPIREALTDLHSILLDLGGPEPFSLSLIE